MLSIFDEPPPEPLRGIDRWLTDAEAAGELGSRDAVLATVDSTGTPTTRVLNVRQCRADGLVFFFDHLSRKGRDLAANPRAAITMYWPGPQRELNATGSFQELTGADSDRLWSERGVIGPAASLASAQGEVSLDRAALIASARAIAATGMPVRPESHRAMLFVPATVEFWQAGADRLHDRLHYQRRPTGWTYWRLQP